MESLTYYLKKRINQNISSMLILEDVRFDAIYFDKTSSGIMLECLCEPIPGIKRYGYRIDIPYGEQRPGNQKHMHIYVKDKEIFAINVDGTAHDGYHNVKIPEKIIPFLKDKGITIPQNNIIECLTTEELHDPLNKSVYRFMDKIHRVENLAIVITNESINTTDVRRNPQIIDFYCHTNLLTTVAASQLNSILADLQNIFNDAGRELIVLEIKNSRYIPERINIYVVWS